MNGLAHEVNFPEVQNHLREAAGWISPELTSTLSTIFERGKFYALAPAATTDAQLRNVENGSLLAEGKETLKGGHRIVEKPTLENDFAELLAKTVVTVKGAAIVGFDVIHLPNPVETSPLDLSSRPFGIFADGQPSMEAVVEFINEYATAWTTVMMVVDHPMTARTPRELAELMVIFAVAAYDGESFVYWMRSGAE